MHSSTSCLPDHWMSALILMLISIMICASSFAQDKHNDSIELIVKEGDTISELLSSIEISSDDRQLAIAELGNVFDSNALRVGQSIKVKLLNYDTQKTGPYHLESLKISLNPLEEIWLSRVSEGIFLARVERKPVIMKLKKASGEIKGSLYQSAVEAGIPPSILHQMIQAYSYDVDFQRDVRNGQQFEAFFTSGYTSNGDYARDGSLIYASLTVKGTPLAIYRFGENDGFFNKEGKSIKRGFLRTPVDGARISSGYGKRTHPVLGYTKMHKGIDFAAPRGTPIYAAGDGTIDYLGRYGSYGKFVRINHGNGYQTAYAHLNRFGKGKRKGGKVKQGDVIGYVGTTGRSTGPHLHYEILKHGKHINPLSVKTLSTQQLSGLKKGIFYGFRRQVDYLIKHEAEAATQLN